MHAASAALLAIAIGCEGPPPEGGATSMSEMADGMEQKAASTTETTTAAPQPERSPVVEEPQIVTAKTPKRGRTLHDQGSYLSAVGSARFRAEHQMILNQIHHALNLYQAEHGEFPKSHDEFMSRIIEPNFIELPELEAGYEYWYDASERSPADMLKQRPIQSGEAE
jgi:hypothetical protein